jgi:endonuclease YncB( thermonuclease family)
VKINNLITYKIFILYVITLLFQTNTFAQFSIQNTKVEYVLDGDTFIIILNNKKEKVRMKCINAPELNDTVINSNNKKVKVGIEARKHLIKLLQTNNNIVTIKCDDRREKYRRLACGVFDKYNNDINLQMVKESYAKAYPSKCFNFIDSIVYLFYEYVGIN